MDDATILIGTDKVTVGLDLGDTHSRCASLILAARSSRKSACEPHRLLFVVGSLACRWRGWYWKPAPAPPGSAVCLRTVGTRSTWPTPASFCLI